MGRSSCRFVRSQVRHVALGSSAQSYCSMQERGVMTVWFTRDVGESLPGHEDKRELTIVAGAKTTKGKPVLVVHLRSEQPLSVCTFYDGQRRDADREGAYKHGNNARASPSPHARLRIVSQTRGRAKVKPEPCQDEYEGKARNGCDHPTRGRRGYAACLQGQTWQPEPARADHQAHGHHDALENRQTAFQLHSAPWSLHAVTSMLVM